MRLTRLRWITIAFALYPTASALGAERSVSHLANDEAASEPARDNRGEANALRRDSAPSHVAESESTSGRAPNRDTALRVPEAAVAPPSLPDDETPMSAPVGNNVTGVSSQAISVPQGTGKVQGMGESFSAQLSTGIATFGVPLSLPSARGGAQPSLSLSYSSAAGAGIAGVGWGIGVGFIARQTDRGVPRYRDPSIGGAWTPEQDRFVFGGGQELIPICLVTGGACAGAIAGEVMPAWGSGWQYFRARVEGDFLRFFWSPDHRTWRVQGKNGVSLELGAPLDAPNDASALESAPGDASKIFRWNLVRQYDAQGAGDPAAAAVPHPANVVTYRYTTVGGVAFLTDIYDTPPAGAGTTTPALSSYAHHARLNYETRPDVTTSHRRGYRIENSLRITGVDVTSKTFVGGTASSRELVRRYHFAYDGGYHASLLASVQLEGRCATPIVENASDALPASTACPRLPAMTFDYQHVAGTPDINGYEAFDETVHALASSPRFSLDSTQSELFDVDADSLPDVLVTSPASPSGSHQVFFNGGETFGAATPMSIDGSLGADARILSLGNRNLASLDVDGDGTVDFLHTPTNLRQSVYTPRRTGGTLQWLARAIATPTAAGQPVDFRDPRIRITDIDGDGLVDILKSSGTAYSTLFSLGRYPGGDGAFGTATWTSAATASLSNEPVKACMPWAGMPVRLEDEGVHLADMNGDGLVDVVRVRFNDVKYWPGNGRGRFGLDVYDAQGRATSCDADTFGDGRHVAMGGAPELPGLQASELRLDDVNGDGLDDLVRVRFDAIDVWLNVNGSAWTQRHVLHLATPSAEKSRVRLVDVNGSGTRDVVFGDGSNYRYIDLLGGQRPWVLTKVSNGLGKTTEIEYSTSTQMMLAAARANQPWASTMPMVTHVVRRVTEKDNLPIAGRPAGVYVVEYTYRDPLFDGRQREMRGFARTTVKHIGDSESPSDFTSTELTLGACADDPGDTSGLPSPCSFAGRWRDNPREALKGLPVVEERYDELGHYLSTAHTQYTLRKLYSGLDGRSVWQAFASRNDAWAYDLGSWVAATDSVSIADVVGDAPRTVTLRSPGRVQNASTIDVDTLGEATAKASLGCVGGTCSLDEKITTKTTPQRIVEGSGWMVRPAETWIEGKDLVKRHWTKTTYDTHGNPLSSRGVLKGTLPLTRAHETGAATAPLPSEASVDGEIVQGTITYDAFGNAIAHAAPGGRCRDVVFDADYKQLPVAETTHAGLLDTGTGCGATALSTIAMYDRGTGSVAVVVGMNGEMTSAAYDGFGRIVSVTRPDPTTGALSALPATTIEYDLPTDAIARPYAIVHTRTQDGVSTSQSSYRDAWAVADGMGRAVVTLEQADPSAGDGGLWIVNGLTDRDAKGAARRVFRAWFWGGADPRTFSLATPPATAFARTRYDAFGRVSETYGYDQKIASHTTYRANSVDMCDAADLELNGEHSNTCASVYKDGHGRVIQQTERIRVSGNMVARMIQTFYLPSGEPWIIQRVQSGMPAVKRWMAYDTLGRMVLNVDPNTSSGFAGPYPSPITAALPATLKTWRYAYRDAGDLVGTSDARGCGANYYYDTAGRALAEDYSPCRAEHAPYSAPNLTTGDGAEVFSRYDVIDSDASAVAAQEPSFAFDSGTYLGRVASVTDRASKMMPRYDRRGRATGGARKIAKPGAPSALVSERFAPRWYVQTVAYDAADRPVDATTGAKSPELLVGGASTLHTDYTKRGTLRKATSSYGDLVNAVIRDADGLITKIAWGDGAATTTSYAYEDPRRRLTSVMTYRAKAPLWSTSSATYPLPDASTTQLLLEDGEFTYDEANNPTVIKDLRVASEWPAGAKPVTRAMKYDDLYRLTRIDYTYSAGDDTWVSPYAAEDGGDAHDARRAKPSPHVAFDKRVRWQTYAYDWLGNTQTSSDDALGFYDRSLSTITNGTPTDGPYQLRSAAGAVSTRDGSLTARYDEAGNLVAMAVVRDGPCLPTGASCSHRYDYGWDEVGRLSRARRWDTATPGVASDPTPTSAPSAELLYAYDGSDSRILKTAVDAQGNARYAAYIFASLELRGAQFDATSGDYERSAWTEVPYLFAHGVRVGRVQYAANDVPRLQSGGTHVFLELPDHLGSASIVNDRDSGELVERGTYQAYGAAESDYRAARWGSFREDYRFTGKEEDVEVGLQYFGKRFYAPTLGRWMSADPLAVHAPGKADLNLYAYVHGKVLAATDPLGLDCDPKMSSEPTVSPSAGGASGARPQAEDPRLVDAAVSHSSPGSLHRHRVGSAGGDLVTDGRVTAGSSFTATYSPRHNQLHLRTDYGDGDFSESFIDMDRPVVTNVNYTSSGGAVSCFNPFELLVTGEAKATKDLIELGVTLAASSVRKRAAVEAVVLDANAITGMFERGERGIVESALAGRQPVVPIQAAKEFILGPPGARSVAERLARGNTLRAWLRANGGRMGAIAPEADALASRIAAGRLARGAKLSSPLSAGDARILISAEREGLPILTRDQELTDVAKVFGIRTEGY